MLTSAQRKLKELMKMYDIKTHRDLAELAGVSLKLVDSWLTTPGCNSYRVIRPVYMNLIRLRLENREKITKK